MKNFTVWFENSRGIRRPIGEANSSTEVNKVIQLFLNQHNFKSYYTRIWRAENEWWYDVGSHSEFFIVTGADENFLKED